MYVETNMKRKKCSLFLRKRFGSSMIYQTSLRARCDQAIHNFVYFPVTVISDRRVWNKGKTLMSPLENKFCLFFIS
jgi:hypothetical protein